MVDLQGQYHKIQQEVDTAILNVVRTAAYINGPEVTQFQQELERYLSVKHVIPCANGTDALQVAMMALELKAGDEVIVPNFTYIATVEVLALLGIKPVLVDVLPDSFNLDPSKLQAALTPKTKAIVPVHLFGQCADMAPILDFAAQHKLYVIEDTAQAIGADYTFPDGTVKKAGTMGDIGTTSFYPSKNLSCMGDGGAIFTHNDELAAKLRMIANHGQNRRYYFDRIGVNSRLDSIQAAVLRIKLRHLGAYTHARQQAAAYYDSALQGVNGLILPKRVANSTHVFHQYTIRVTNGKRDGLQNHLTSKAIPSVVFYPLGVHQQTAYQTPEYTDAHFPITVQLGNEVLSLPMHTELDTTQLQYITTAITEYLQ
jgi:dTDP-4-amino-4,6-dideoxygalactose transaminase